MGSHLREKIGDENIVLGTDEEKAITKAIRTVFPNSTHLLCTLHLKENVRRYLSDKVGCNTKDRETIVSKIFGKEGLVYSRDEFQFHTKVQYMECFFDLYPKFKDYFERRLGHLLVENICKPLQKNVISELWTNNNSESINNRLKQSVAWKAQKLPDLIDKISTVSSIQFLDLRRSLVDKGNFEIYGKMKRYKVNLNIWQEKTNKEKTHIFETFLKKIKSTASENRMKASDDNFCIPRTAAVAKKPNQRKRPRAEKAGKKLC